MDFMLKPLIGTLAIVCVITAADSWAQSGCTENDKKLIRQLLASVSRPNNWEATQSVVRQIDQQLTAGCKQVLAQQNSQNPPEPAGQDVPERDESRGGFGTDSTGPRELLD